MIKNGFRPEIEMQASDRFTGALNSSQVVAQVLSAVLCLPSFGAHAGRASSLPWNNCKETSFAFETRRKIMPSQWHLFLVVVAISSRSLDQRSLEIEDWGGGQTLEVRTSVASPSFTFLFRPITNISCLDPFIQSVLKGRGWSGCLRDRKRRVIICCRVL